MTLTTCIECGALSDTAHCPDHRAKKIKTNTDHAAFANNSKWKKFSKKLRKLSPFCEQCGATEDLTVDHIVRVTDRPEWTYEPDNCRVLCRRCNGLIANQPANIAVETNIAAKIAASHFNRSVKKTGGTTQADDLIRPPSEKDFRSQSGMIQEKEVS